MKAWSASLVAAGVVLVAACGDDGVTGGSGGSGAASTGGDAPGGGGTAGDATGGTSSGGAPLGGAGGTGGQAAGGAPPMNSGDCDSDLDCAPNTQCLEVAPGGYRVCSDVVTEATACSGSGLDECCTTLDCAAGLCLSTPLTPFCGGVQPLDYNVCAVAQCENQGDCPGQDSVCLPAPMLGYKVPACYNAQCRHDTDCGAEAGGICAPVEEPCCGGSSGLYCVYPSDGCRTNADCPNGYCQPDAERASCQAGAPTCPA